MVDFDQIKQNRYVYSKETGKKYFSNQELFQSNEKHKNLIYELDGGKWSNFNWLIEPSESFDKLLKERCIQLRDKYNYLILYFSGGSDSETTLQSFIRSEIHLDEIVTNVFEINEKDPPLLDVEFAIEKLKIYSKLIPKTKITINKLSRDIFLNFTKKQLWIDSTFNGTLGHFRRMPLSVAQELGQKVNYREPKPVGHIFAETKPHLLKKADGYYVIWSVPLSVASHWAEWFYTSFEFPKLHIKQCYLVKNYFKKLKTEYTIINEVGEIRDHLIKACRYSFDNRFQPPKTMGLLKDFKNIHSEDGLVINHLRKYDKESYDVYSMGTVKTMLSGVINRNLLNRDSGNLRVIASQQFYLGK